MRRTIKFGLNKVTPTPSTLRADVTVDAAGSQTDVDLGQLYLHHYHDSYPAAPPKPDPSSFEYLHLVSHSSDFRFNAHVKQASVVKRRTISAEHGQAFCRLLLSDHFGIVYYAHLGEVLSRSTHAAFGGMKIMRSAPGDIPDYLCARNVMKPFIAEAKGRMSPVDFASADFQKWRKQFSRIRVTSVAGADISLKGFIVATQLVTEACNRLLHTTAYIEDPETSGRAAVAEESSRIGRVIISVHYGRVFSKLGLPAIAAALTEGYPLTRELRFQVPVWTCGVSPFQGREYIGGFYRLPVGVGPVLTDRGWQQPFELGAGHVVFIGLERSIAQVVARAARGSWNDLDVLSHADPSGGWSSEFAWLLDGTVAAPASFFVPTGVVEL